ncbi:hypothetical protein KC851_03190 [Candidatus Kaiserbacteria bacterium]|nr:hypothetical protein [Candidatus Kaiserbacteria bacterium]
MSHEELKTELEKELAELTADLKKIAVLNPTTNDWVARPPIEDVASADKNTEADSAEEWGERRAVLAQLETRYYNLVRALSKFSNGTYGLCEVSGNPIEANRLKANPAARTNLANIDRENELPI